MNKKKVAFGLLIVGVVGVLIISFTANLFLAPNIVIIEKKEEFLLIRDTDKLNDIWTQLSQKTHIKRPATLKQAAKILKYDQIRAGRYRVVDGMNNLSLVKLLRSGNQTPVQLKFNNIRTKELLASRLSQQLMPDSTELVTLLNDTAVLSQYGLDPYTSISLFLPNTYEVFWNISAQKLFERMYREYNIFWTEERKKKAAAIPMTQTQVSTLASIVDAETNAKAEKPIIAGLYINRLRKGMPLQADPTVIFATGDFTIRRVLNVHTQMESPYNTYRNKGLPPGPIRVASLSGLDAVLDYDKNNYIFMCAKETLNGEHNFATTWAEHQRNAAKYQKALNERGIR